MVFLNGTSQKVQVSPLLGRTVGFSIQALQTNDAQRLMESNTFEIKVKQGTTGKYFSQNARYELMWYWGDAVFLG